MAKVRLSVTLKLQAVATTLLATAIAVSLTDVAGAAHTASIAVGDLVDDGTGTAVAVVDLTDDVPTGDFTGSAQATDATGASVGDPAAFTGTVPADGSTGTGGQQWIPVSVTPQFS